VTEVNRIAILDDYQNVALPALIDVLRERLIACAALDVFDIEPLPADHPFRSLENVLSTPHNSYVAREL
jgi:phosphoglycerate dehydrogenase-like enzyme